MLRQKIAVAEYEKLAETFDPSGFDVEAITDLAIEAGMRYVNLTSCHHEGFCLWDSAVEPYNSVKHGGRDLVRELAEACDRKGLGFFTYFTHVLNWRHPYAPTFDIISNGRPDYPDGDPRYVLEKVEDWAEYWKWSHACIRELCALEAPLAGVWLDIIRMYYEAPQHVPIEDTYALIREARPEALISFKQGATGTEDFASPEFHFASQGDSLRKAGRPDAAEVADRAWAANKDKHNEICMTLQHGGWSYVEGQPYKQADEVWSSLAYADAHDCNLLANIGPLPDGALPDEPVGILRDLGARIRSEGYPEPGAAETPGRSMKADAESAHTGDPVYSPPTEAQTSNLPSVGKVLPELSPSYANPKLPLIFSVPPITIEPEND